MKHLTWIPIATFVAALTLAGCDQPQNPGGQSMGTANEQNQSTGGTSGTTGGTSGTSGSTGAMQQQDTSG